MYVSSTSSLLALVGVLSSLAAAAPGAGLVAARQVPRYPPTSVSKGFNLIANVTDRSKDLSPSVNGFALGGIHVGPPNSRAVLEPQGQPGERLFYLNGTVSDIEFETTRVVSDAGTPLFPWGFHVQGPQEFDTPANPDFHAIYINGGTTTDVGITRFPDPIAMLRNRLSSPGGTFIVCNHVVPYYQREFLVVDYVYPSTDPATKLPTVAVPAGCAPIALLPQCATLNDLPKGSYSSHEFALDLNCYDDVAAIDWSKYGS